MCLPSKIKRHFLGFFADMLALLDYLKVPVRQKVPQQPICRFVGFQMVSWSIQNCLLGKNTSTSQQAEFRLSVGILALLEYSNVPTITSNRQNVPQQAIFKLSGGLLVLLEYSKVPSSLQATSAAHALFRLSSGLLEYIQMCLPIKKWLNLALFRFVCFQLVS